MSERPDRPSAERAADGGTDDSVERTDSPGERSTVEAFISGEVTDEPATDSPATVVGTLTSGTPETARTVPIGRRRTDGGAVTFAAFGHAVTVTVDGAVEVEGVEVRRKRN